MGWSNSAPLSGNHVWTGNAQLISSQPQINSSQFSSFRCLDRASLCWSGAPGAGARSGDVGILSWGDDGVWNRGAGRGGASADAFARAYRSGTAFALATKG
jgi:hypothetical protein